MLGDGLVREPDGPVRAGQRAQLAGREELLHLRAAQGQVDGHPVAAAGHRDQRLGDEDLAHRVEQRAEHGAGGEARGVQRQRRQHVDRQQALVAQLAQHVAQQRGRLAHQELVRRIVPGNVVAGRRRPVRALHQEAEERLLLGREGHDERRAVTRHQTPLAEGAFGPEGDLDRRRQLHGLTVPGQPLLGRPAAAGQRDPPPRAGPGHHRPLDDRSRHPCAPRPQPLDAPQEQQDPGPDRGQRRRDLPGRDRSGHGRRGRTGRRTGSRR